MDSQKTVYLLGAGASAHAGYPLIADFMTVLPSHRPPGNSQLSNFFSFMESIHQKFPEKNIEELILLASSPHLPEYRSLVQMIQTGTDEEDIGLYYVRAPLKYCIVFLLDEIARRTPLTPAVSRFVSATRGPIITFNWDVLFDKAIAETCGVDWSSVVTFADSSRAYLKLHGSGDCLYCLNCKTVFRITVGNIGVRLVESIQKCPSCGGVESYGNERTTYNSEPCIIGFSRNKKADVSQVPLLLTQWNMARQLLSSCEELIVIGFSFNEIDRHVLDFLDGVMRRREKPLVVTVVNPDSSNKFRSNVTRALSGGQEITAEGREFKLNRYGQVLQIRFEAAGFEEYVESI